MVNTKNKAPLIISNTTYPGWEATIDGLPSEIMQVNYMFQSIIVPKGKHVIEIKYQPISFYNGLRISTIGIAMTILATLYLWKRKYQ